MSQPKLIITKAQLKGLIQYYELYGVEAMEFSRAHLDETFAEFGPVPSPLLPPSADGRRAFASEGAQVIQFPKKNLPSDPDPVA